MLKRKMSSFKNPLQSIFALLTFTIVASGMTVQSLAADTHASEPLVIETATHTDFEVVELASGLGVPWGLAFIADDEVVITERAGQIKHLNLTSKKVTTMTNAPEIMASGQGGLLDVAVPPAELNSPWVYFTYSKGVQQRDIHTGKTNSSIKGATVLARAKKQDNAWVDWEELLVTQSATGTGRHFGSRITFDNDGHLYFSVGDRGERPTAQDNSNHAGTVIRLKLDGSIPADNPYVGSADALPEIWSFGHRNAQGLAYDQASDKLWLIEHGPRGGDEINLVLPKRNYGWPVISYGKEYWGPISVGESTAKPGMEQPVKQYTPSIAPSSLILYQGDAFPNWRGSLFTGALKLRHLNRVVLNQAGEAVHEERLLEPLDERIRALAEGPDGLIYLSTDTGKILRLEPSSAN